MLDELYRLASTDLAPQATKSCGSLTTPSQHLEEKTIMRMAECFVRDHSTEVIFTPLV